MDAIPPGAAESRCVQAKPGPHRPAGYLPGDLGGSRDGSVAITCLLEGGGGKHAGAGLWPAAGDPVSRLVDWFSSCLLALVRRFFNRGRGRNEQGVLAV